MTAPFDDLSTFRVLLAERPGPDTAAIAAAEARDAQLTKPAGALGRLEELAIWYAGWRGDARPRMERPQVAVFAGNHGVVARGVSAFPAAVTAQMVGNFEAGGAAVNQLAQAFGARMTAHPIDLDRPTGDFVEGPAMSEAELVDALAIGWNAVDPEADLFVAGEMGIGNTCSAAAIAHALEGAGPRIGPAGARGSTMPVSRARPRPWRRAWPGSPVRRTRWRCCASWAGARSRRWRALSWPRGITASR